MRRARTRYYVDEVIGRSGLRNLVALTIAFLVVFLVLGAARAVAALVFPGRIEEGRDPLRQLWLTWLEITDPGTQAYDIETSAGFKIFAVAAAVLGIAMLSMVIALMTSALDERLRRQRLGHTTVVEEDHVVILGWNTNIVPLVVELLEAGKTGEPQCVVILSDRSKEEMDEVLRVRLPPKQRGACRVVTRNGRPSSPASIALTSPATARAVVVLRNGRAEEQADEPTVKTVVAALQQTAERKPPVIAELHDRASRRVVREADPRVVTIDPHGTVAKVMVQCTRTTHLASVMTELLSFRGSEIILHEVPEAVGTRFGNIGRHLRRCVPLGLLDADGGLVLPPRPDDVVPPGAVLAVLADDRQAIRWVSEPFPMPSPAPLPDVTEEERPEHALVIGWTEATRHVVVELEKHLPEGSKLEVAARTEEGLRDEALPSLDLVSRPLAVRAREEQVSLSSLAELEVAEADSIVLLGEVDPASPRRRDHTDAVTLNLLLRLQSLLAASLSGQAARDGKRIATPARQPRIYCEALDAENADLLAHSGAHDVIVTSQLVSSMLAQVAVDKRVKRLYDSLFREDGHEVVLKPVEWYIGGLPRVVTFAELIVQAGQRQEIALGYRLAGNGTDGGPGITINPSREDRVSLTPQDFVIVLAEDRGVTAPRGEPQPHERQADTGLR